MTGLPTLAAAPGADPDTGSRPAGPAPRTTRARLVSGVRRVLIVVVLAAVCYAVASEWSTVSSTMRTLSWSSIVLSGTALVAGLLAATVG